MMKTARQSKVLPVHIRWMIRRDMPAVLAIEEDVFIWPWFEEDFMRELRERNVIGMVAEASERIVGFMVYAIEKHRLEILDFAVARTFWRRGIGQQMIDKLKSKLSANHRNRICMDIRERNVDAQLFLRAMGFQCVETIHGRWQEEADDDAYRFSFRYRRDA